MTRTYEAVIIYDSSLSEAGLKEEISKVEAIVEGHGGKVSSVDIWGKRELAYLIRKQQYGTYVLMIFDGDNALVADLERQLRINDARLRHLIVNKDKYAPDFKARPEERPTSTGSRGPRRDEGEEGKDALEKSPATVAATSESADTSGSGSVDTAA